jgi:hypothetical protein
MEAIVKYENSEQLYKFLIDNFGLIKIKDKYDPKNFGNFIIELSAINFFIRYVNDRSVLVVEVASKKDPNNWFDLSFIRDFYHPDKLNRDESELDNPTRIRMLNDFLQKNFDQINEWFEERNYFTNKVKLEQLLKEQFKRRFPGMV